MLKQTAVLFSAIVVLLSSCDDISKMFPINTFDGSFPKTNISIASVLGNELIMKEGTDTLHLAISSDKNSNLIKNSKTGDTIFYGTVSKFRGSYYFNEHLSDTSFRIFAVKISGNLIYGLDEAMKESFIVDRIIERGNYPKLVEKMDTGKNIIRLHPIKTELKKLFSEVIDSLTPDTILQQGENNTPMTDSIIATSKIDSDDYQLLSKVYPNPTKDFVTIELQQQGIVNYQLINLNGKVVSKGQLTNVKSQLDISQQPVGIYVLTLTNSDGKQPESIKIVKVK